MNNIQQQPVPGQHYATTVVFANLQTKGPIQPLTKLWYGTVHGVRDGIHTLRYMA